MKEDKPLHPANVGFLRSVVVMARADCLANLIEKSGFCRSRRGGNVPGGWPLRVITLSLWPIRLLTLESSMETSLTVHLFKWFKSLKKFNKSRTDLNRLNDLNNFMRSHSIPPARDEPACFSANKKPDPLLRQTNPSDRESGWGQLPRSLLPYLSADSLDETHSNLLQ